MSVTVAGIPHTAKKSDNFYLTLCAISAIVALAFWPLFLAGWTFIRLMAEEDGRKNPGIFSSKELWGLMGIGYAALVPAVIALQFWSTLAAWQAVALWFLYAAGILFGITVFALFCLISFGLDAEDEDSWNAAD